MFSVITNIYNKKTKGPTLMDLIFMVPYILVISFIQIPTTCTYLFIYLFVYLSVLHVSGYAHLQELQTYFANHRCVYSVEDRILNVIKLCGAV
jgi:hypothetical protein